MHTTKELLSDRLSRIILLAGLLLNGGTWAAAFWLWRQQLELMPLHYTIYYDIDLTGPANRVWWLPAFGSVVLFLHLLIGFVYRHRIWLRAWLAIATVIVALLFFVILALIYRVRLLPQ